MVTIFILNGRLSDLPFRQCKGTKKSCVLQIKSQKRHEKRHVQKIVPFQPTFFTVFVQSTLRVASLQLKFPPSPIWKIYPIYLYIFIYIIYRHIFSLGIGIKINCNTATLQRQVSTTLILIDSFSLFPDVVDSRFTEQVDNLPEIVDSVPGFVDISPKVFFLVSF